MILCLCIIVFIIGCCMEASGKDWERSERNKERRHQELMRAQKRRKTITRRRVLRDERGRFVAEEMTVEGDFND